MQAIKLSKPVYCDKEKYEKLNLDFTRLTPSQQNSNLSFEFFAQAARVPVAVIEKLPRNDLGKVSEAYISYKKVTATAEQIANHASKKLLGGKN